MHNVQPNLQRLVARVATHVQELRAELDRDDAEYNLEDMAARVAAEINALRQATREAYSTVRDGVARLVVRVGALRRSLRVHVEEEEEEEEQQQQQQQVNMTSSSFSISSDVDDQNKDPTFDLMSESSDTESSDTQNRTRGGGAKRATAPGATL